MRNRLLFYPRLAVTGIRKNHRTYVPYLLACIGLIMMYYIFHYLRRSPQVAAMRGGETLQTMLAMGGWVFSFFSVLFLFYTNSFLIRNRKKEFGLYNILGMNKWDIARILFVECLIMAFLSLGGGLFCGILFSKLAQLWIASVLQDVADMTFQVDFGAIRHTAEIFSLIYALILLHDLFEVGKSKPIDLLHGGNVGEKPPKANWVLAFLGALILGAAYYIAVTIQDPLSALLMFFVAVGMVILATYLLFIAGSVVLCRLLQKNKRYYYKANHFISVSSMAYRMKRNGAGLASICILATMVMVMLSSVASLYVGNEDRLYGRYPKEFELSVATLDDAAYRKMRGAVDEVLQMRRLAEQNVQDIRYFAFSGYLDGERVILDEVKVTDVVLDFGKLRDLYFIPLEDYNRLTGKKETLGKNEVLVYAGEEPYEYGAISIDGMETRTVRKTVEKFLDVGWDFANISSSLFLIVPGLEDIEEADRAQRQVYETWYSKPHHVYSFDVEADKEELLAIAGELRQKMAESGIDGWSFSAREQEREDFFSIYNGLFILGILLGIIFLGATVLIMYYKQVTEGFEDQAKFDIMQKVGMTKGLIRRSIHSQMLTVFLAPLLLAGIHTAFAFPIVQKLLLLLGVVNVRLLASVDVLCFLLFAMFYTLVYLATSKVYYGIVSGRPGRAGGGR